MAPEHRTKDNLRLTSGIRCSAAEVLEAADLVAVVAQREPNPEGHRAVIVQHRIGVCHADERFGENSAGLRLPSHIIQGGIRRVKFRRARREHEVLLLDAEEVDGEEADERPAGGARRQIAPIHHPNDERGERDDKKRPPCADHNRGIVAGDGVVQLIARP